MTERIRKKEAERASTRKTREIKHLLKMCLYLYFQVLFIQCIKTENLPIEVKQAL